MRLTGGGNPRRGRLEVLVDGRWGILAGPLPDAAAMIVCKQLGFVKGGFPLAAGTIADQGPGYLHYAAWFSCVGDEASLMDCIQNPDPTTEGLDAGVECQGTQCRFCLAQVNQ